MIVLDTNVISEMTKKSPAPQVQAWLDRQSIETLYLTSITIAEEGFGILAMPKGKRRDELYGALVRTQQVFAGRILPFDSDAAYRYAELAVAAKSIGRGFPTPDGYIAAIAATRGFAVATRDVAPFEAGGVSIINPWDYSYD